jgi:imidazolonepropionase-like amidohydrolase
MKIKPIIITGLLTVSLLVFFMLLPQPDTIENKPTNNSPVDKHFVIRHVRLYDGEKLFENTDIEINAGIVLKIANNIEVNKNIKIIDATDKTLIPGLIDTHTHSYGTALTDALNFGVTTELDMFSMPEFSSKHIKARDNLSNIFSADLFSSSILATAPNGHGTEYGFDIPVLTAPDQASQFTKDRIAEGASYIKAVYNSKQAKRQYFPSISLEILAALSTSAHENDMMLVVHTDNLISAKQAVQVGVNGLVHSFMDAIIDDELIELMIDNNVFMIPTFTVQASISGLSDPQELLQNTNISKFISTQQKQQLLTPFPDFGIPHEGFNNALISVKKLFDAGVSILAGTDAPNPGTTHGISLHHELQYLVEAGLSTTQAIYAATGAPGKHFPLDLRGSLKVGAKASMVLINGNPFDDILQTTNIDRIWKNGSLFIRQIPSDEIIDSLVVKPGLITDFNSSKEKTLSGYGIIASTDQLAGGNSVVKLSLQSRDKAHDKYISIEGEIKKGFMYRWSGISYIPGSNQQNGANLNNIKLIKFDAKTSDKANELSLMAFQSGSMIPYTVKLKLTRQWQTYTINITDFNNLDWSNIANISFVITDNLGNFKFMLDNIYFE